MSAVEYIQHHPVIGFTVCLCHLVFSKLIITSYQVPAIVMQCFQLGAWCVTITVGLITIYGFFKMRKNEK